MYIIEIFVLSILDRSTDLLTMLERLEELWLLLGISECKKFEVEFKHFYLPPDYHIRLQEHISNRQQKPHENRNDYTTDLHEKSSL